MKKTLLSFFALLLVGVSGAWADGLPTPVYSEDFESATSVSDVTGATQTGSGAIQSGDAKFGKYYINMPGATTSTTRTNYLTISTDAFSKCATNKAVTVSFWVNPTEANTNATGTYWGSMFVAYGTGGNAAHGYPFGLDTRACLAAHSSLYNCYYDNNGTQNTAWLTNGWHHVAITYAKGGTDEAPTTEVKQYIDGVLKQSYSFTSTNTEDATIIEVNSLDQLTEFVIGGNSPVWEDSDNGYAYDEISIYDQTLTADQVKQIAYSKTVVGDVVTVADIDFSNAITDGAVAGTKGSMVISSDATYPTTINSDGHLDLGKGTHVVKFEPTGSYDILHATFKLAFGLLSKRSVGFGFKDASGNTLKSFSCTAYGSADITNDFGVTFDDIYNSSNTVIWERATNFDITIDYRTKTITTKTKCYKGGSTTVQNTYVKTFDSLDPIAQFYVTSNYQNTGRDCQFDDLVITNQNETSQTYTVLYGVPSINEYGNISSVANQTSFTGDANEKTDVTFNDGNGTNCDAAMPIGGSVLYSSTSSSWTKNFASPVTSGKVVFAGNYSVSANSNGTFRLLDSKGNAIFQSMDGSNSANGTYDAAIICGTAISNWIRQPRKAAYGVKNITVDLDARTVSYDLIFSSGNNSYNEVTGSIDLPEDITDVKGLTVYKSNYGAYLDNVMLYSVTAPTAAPLYENTCDNTDGWTSAGTLSASDGNVIVAAGSGVSGNRDSYFTFPTEVSSLTTGKYKVSFDFKFSSASGTANRSAASIKLNGSKSTLFSADASWTGTGTETVQQSTYTANGTSFDIAKSVWNTLTAIVDLDKKVMSVKLVNASGDVLYENSCVSFASQSLKNIYITNPRGNRLTYIDNIIVDYSDEAIIATKTSQELLKGFKTFYDANASYIVDDNTTICIAETPAEDKVLVKSIDGETVIPAGTPVLIQTTAEDYKMTLTPTTEAAASSSYTDNALEAATEAVAVDHAYVLGYLPEENANPDWGFGFYEYTAALAVNQVYVTYSGGSGEAKKLTIIFDEDPIITEVSGISEAKAAVKTVKYAKDGQLIIKAANGSFNAAGARVK